MSILACMAIILAASIIQGVTGFGFALAAVPLLSVFIMPQDVVPLVVLLSLATNLIIMYGVRKSLRIADIKLLVVSGILGIPAGVYLLKIADMNFFKIAVGLVICITALAMISGFKIRMKNSAAASLTAGLLSGVLNGSISMSGPPVVVFLADRSNDADAFKANLTAYAIIINVITMILYFTGSMMKPDILKNFLYFMPALITGIFTGMYLSRRMKYDLFRKVILILLIITGVSTLITTLVKVI